MLALAMAAMKDCFTVVATQAANAHGYSTVEEMATAAAAELGGAGGADDMAVARQELTALITKDARLRAVLELAEKLNTSAHRLVICHLPSVLKHLEQGAATASKEAEEPYVTWPDFAAEMQERLADAALGLRPVMAVPSKAARDALYERIDTNGNGVISLNEIDKSVVDGTIGRTLAPNHPCAPPSFATTATATHDCCEADCCAAQAFRPQACDPARLPRCRRGRHGLRRAGRVHQAPPVHRVLQQPLVRCSLSRCVLVLLDTH